MINLLIPECQGGSHSRSSLQRMWSTVVASELSTKTMSENYFEETWTNLMCLKFQILTLDSTCIKMHSITAFPLQGLQWQDLGETARGGRVSAARRCSAHLRSLPPAVPCCWRFGRRGTHFYGRLNGGDWGDWNKKLSVVFVHLW